MTSDTLVVDDDGYGPANTEVVPGNGLRGLTERARQVGRARRGVGQPAGRLPAPRHDQTRRPMSGAPIRLLLADDQALVRGALAALLDLEADLTVVAQVGRGDEVLHAAREHAADVALLDVEMPGTDGITARPSCAGPTRRAGR